MDTTLTHHGIIGQKWGVRRFQNKEGGLTKEGKERYSDSSDKKVKESKEGTDKEKNTIDEDTKKKIAIGAAAVTSLLAIYGASRAYDHFIPKNIPVTRQELSHYTWVWAGRPELGMRPVYKERIDMIPNPKRIENRFRRPKT